jgi:hypothetical protein
VGRNGRPGRAIITAAFQQRLVDHEAMMLSLGRFARLRRR